MPIFKKKRRGEDGKIRFSAPRSIHVIDNTDADTDTVVETVTVTIIVT